MTNKFTDIRWRAAHGGNSANVTSCKLNSGEGHILYFKKNISSNYFESSVNIIFFYIIILNFYWIRAQSWQNKHRSNIVKVLK